MHPAQGSGGSCVDVGEGCVGWAGLLQDTRLRGVLLVFAPRPGVRWELCRCGRGSAFYVVWEACDLVVGATVNTYGSTYAENMISHPTPDPAHRRPRLRDGECGWRGRCIISGASAAWAHAKSAASRAQLADEEAVTGSMKTCRSGSEGGGDGGRAVARGWRMCGGDTGSTGRGTDAREGSRVASVRPPPLLDAGAEW